MKSHRVGSKEKKAGVLANLSVTSSRCLLQGYLRGDNEETEYEANHSLPGA